jgi:hypothetical protein
VTSPARQTEAQETGAAFQVALAAIGVSTIEEALDLWDDVNPAKAQATGARWLTRAVALVMSRRSLSRQLAYAYYRLVRALITGRTVPDPYHPIKSNPTLGDLRREFRELLEQVQATMPAARSEQARRAVERISQPDNSDESSGSTEVEIVAPEPLEGDGDVIELDELENILDLEEELDDLAREESVTNLEALGSNGIERRLERGPKSLTPEEAHTESGARQAAAAARIAMNGGRSTLWVVGSQDRAVTGWARVSRTGTPCGFCAMLLSKGFVTRDGERSGGLYTSERAALGDSYEDGDLFHDNCQCYAEQIFSTAQYEQDPRFDLNREYAELWPKVTDGYGGRDALNVWRRYIRKRNKELDLESGPVAA